MVVAGALHGDERRSRATPSRALCTRQYDATASLLFRDPAIDERLFPGTFFTPSDDPQRKAATDVRLVSLDAVARRVATGGTLGLNAGEVRESVQIEPDGNSDVVAITARQPSARAAAALANRYATRVRGVSSRRRPRKDPAGGEARPRAAGPAAARPAGGEQGMTLAERASQLESLAAVQTGNAEIVERAEVPLSQAAPHPRRSAMIGGVLGLLVGVGLAMLLSRLDQRLRDASEAAALLGAPVLAEISADKRLTTRPSAEWIIDPDTPEGFRLLRTTLRYFMPEEQRAMTVLVTSAVPGEGKTTSSWNLAVAAASDGDAVLLVEADLRRPRIIPGWGQGGGRTRPPARRPEHLRGGGDADDRGGNTSRMAATAGSTCSSRESVRRIRCSCSSHGACESCWSTPGSTTTSSWWTAPR